MTEIKTLTVNLKELQLTAGAPAIVSQAAGELVSVADASDRALTGLTLYGKTTQDGTPSPNNPVPLVSAGDSGSVGVTVAGKNLLWFTPSASTVTQDGLTFENHADGSITVNGTATASGWYFMRYHSTLAGYFRLKRGSYTFSGTSTHAESGKIVMRFQSYPYAASMDWPLTAQAPQKTFTLTEDTSFLLGILYYEGAVIENQVFKPQIEVGSVATAYEPYTEQALAVSTPNGLPGIPVSSGGNYTDENGQQWVCDEVDFARGVYVQQVGMHSFDGTESIIEVADLGENVRIAIATGFVGVKSRGLFSHGVYTTGYSNDTAHAYCNENKYAYLFLPVEEATADAVREYLADQYNNGTPVTILAPLVIPAETALDEKNLTAYASMHTNKPNTTVMNDAGAHMKLSYVADTKSYIDNKFTELQNAVLAAGANI